jgi:aryl-alcohol dehydrogenase-like predicted oxidoreductase
MTMQYRPLGRSGIQVSAISLGCSGYWGKATFPEAKAEAVIREAFDRGVNFFDTGHHYCDFQAEPRLGRILRPLIAAGHRERLIISSKASDGGATRRSLSRRLLRRRAERDYSPDYIETTCAASILNLGCDYLDVFQLHGAREADITQTLIDRLLDMKRRGMYRLLGVNTHSESFNRFVASHPDIFDMSLIDYNVLQLDRDPMIEALHSAGLGVVAGTVLGQAHLVPGKIGSVRGLSDLWYLARARLKPESRRLGEVAATMRETLARVEGMSAAQAAFAYVLGNPAIASCVFGTTRVLNAIEVIDSIDKQLSPHDRQAIRAVFEALPSTVSH